MTIEDRRDWLLDQPHIRFVSSLPRPPVAPYTSHLVLDRLIMSNTELYPLFPSATHPAIPIAARILSTLRNLTGPGKGNDLKPEERAALVGIAAVLGCEKWVPLI